MGISLSISDELIIIFKIDNQLSKIKKSLSRRGARLFLDALNAEKLYKMTGIQHLDSTIYP